jgi:hypothetical protein
MLIASDNLAGFMPCSGGTNGRVAQDTCNDLQQDQVRGEKKETKLVVRKIN